MGIDEIWFQRNSLLITMTEQHFFTYFEPRFLSIYASRESEVSCLQTLLNSIPLFWKYLFLSTHQVRHYRLGDKIAEKGENIQLVHVVGDKLKEERLRHLTKGCVGLY
jgi:hypothetical protein